MAAGYTMTIDGKSAKGSQSTGVINPAPENLRRSSRLLEGRTRSGDERRSEGVPVVEQGHQRAPQGPPGSRRCAATAARRVGADAHARAGQAARQGGPGNYGHLDVVRIHGDARSASEVLQDTPQGKIEIKRKPLGVVAAITPMELSADARDVEIAPAFLAGNTIVLKPSPYTPITTLMLGEILRDIVPPE